jgi:hypothetical protein
MDVIMPGGGDECEMTVKENDNDGWNSDAAVLWFERRQNRDAIE